MSVRNPIILSFLHEPGILPLYLSHQQMSSFTPTQRNNSFIVQCLIFSQLDYLALGIVVKSVFSQRYNDSILS